MLSGNFFCGRQWGCCGLGRVTGGGLLTASEGLRCHRARLPRWPCSPKATTDTRDHQRFKRCWYIRGAANEGDTGTVVRVRVGGSIPNSSQDPTGFPEKSHRPAFSKVKVVTFPKFSHKAPAWVFQLKRAQLRRKYACRTPTLTSTSRLDDRSTLPSVAPLPSCRVLHLLPLPGVAATRQGHHSPAACPRCRAISKSTAASERCCEGKGGRSKRQNPPTRASTCKMRQIG